MAKEIKNIGASVRARLLQYAKASGQSFDLVLTRFALERLLFRLSRSPHADRFVLKGAMLMMSWFDDPHRGTRDLDLLGFGDPNPERMLATFREILAQDADDGVEFDAEALRVDRIREELEYGGLRLRTTASISGARISLTIDIGFGDALEPGDEELDYPSMLDFPMPRLRGYARETVIAEKFQAMVALGRANSRMKDFYDIWILSRSFAFDDDRLARAIAATFARRGTASRTCLDGYEMAKQGRAGQALAIAAIGSFIGGLVATAGLVVLAKPLTSLALKFGPPEFFSLMLVGLSLVTGLAGKSIVRALMSAILGLLVSMVGIDPVMGAPRYTFGNLNLLGGINVVIVAMGLFGVGEILLGLEGREDDANSRPKAPTLRLSGEDIRRSIMPIVRGTGIGFFLGLIPGVGAVVPTVMSYVAERKFSKTPNKFGTGMIEGVAGPETANNAYSNAALIPSQAGTQFRPRLRKLHPVPSGFVVLLHPLGSSWRRP